MKSEAALRTSSLPERFVEVERVVDSVSIGELSLNRAGICVQMPGGDMVTGSAASAVEDPAPRAAFETWERLALLEAIRERSTFAVRDAEGSPTGLLPKSLVFPESDDPACWRPARSNGVALHVDWARARDRAWWELCERDQVLRAWHGHARPRLIEGPRDSRLAATGALYDWQLASFESAEHEPVVAVFGVFGFPLQAGSPLVVGYGARPSRADAVAAATGEALQSLAFLWGEEIPLDSPPPGPTSMHHLERLIWPGSSGTIRRWLREGHLQYASEPSPPALGEAEGFVDLTPAWLEGRARVVRALARDAWPLHFGEGPLSRHLPAHLRLHPIP